VRRKALYSVVCKRRPRIPRSRLSSLKLVRHAQIDRLLVFNLREYYGAVVEMITRTRYNDIMN